MEEVNDKYSTRGNEQKNHRREKDKMDLTDGSNSKTISKNIGGEKTT